MNTREIFVDSSRSGSLSNSFSLFLQTPLINVVKADLVTAAIPVTSQNTGPYMFLDVSELRRPIGIDASARVSNTISETVTSFAVIPVDVASGSVKYYKEQSDYPISVEFPHPIDKIDRLTFRLLNQASNLIPVPVLSNVSCVVRFHMLPPSTFVPEIPKEEEVEESIPKLTTVQSYFAMMLIAIVFILFFIRKKS
jgi:hypothetical protein